LEQAERLIDIAVEAGSDAVKFQFFRAQTLYLKTAGPCAYLKQDRSIYDIVSEMEMPEEWLPELVQYCRQKGILFLASVVDEELADRLDPYVLAYKIPSYEMTHLPLVCHIARKGKPVIIATGTAQLEEVRETVEAFLETGNRDLILMQCTASYPAPLESLNVRSIPTLKAAFGVPVGLSDHSRDPLVGPLAAVGVGAHLIEKHFTLSNHLPGPDHRFALEPKELTLMVQKIREVEKVLGNGEKRMHPVEKELREFARRSIFATRDIPPGQPLTRENVAVLRCGRLPFGLAPKEFPHLLGRTARRLIETGGTIRWEDLG
jgi:N-acetylneuraminate synthase